MTLKTCRDDDDEFDDHDEDANVFVCVAINLCESQ